MVSVNSKKSFPSLVWPKSKPKSEVPKTAKTTEMKVQTNTHATMRLEKFEKKKKGPVLTDRNGQVYAIGTGADLEDVKRLTGASAKIKIHMRSLNVMIETLLQMNKKPTIYSKAMSKLNGRITLLPATLKPLHFLLNWLMKWLKRA